MRALFACWREEALASSRIRSRTLSRFAKTAEALVSEAFFLWRERNRAAHGKAKVLTALARVSDRRRFERAEMRLALKTWRSNACGGNEGGNGECKVEPEDELEAVAGVFVEAAAAFSTAASVRTGIFTGRVGGGKRDMLGVVLEVGSRVFFLVWWGSVVTLCVLLLGRSCSTR